MLICQMSIPVLRSGTFRPTGSRSKHRPKSSENHTSIFLNITFLLLKKFNMAIFYSNIKWPASKNLASTLNGLKITKKKIWNFSLYRKIQTGSGSGAKLSRSATLANSNYFLSFLRWKWMMAACTHYTFVVKYILAVLRIRFMKRIRLANNKPNHGQF